MSESSTYLYWTVMFSIKITVNKYTSIIKQIYVVLSFIWLYTIPLMNHNHGRRLYVQNWRKKTKKHIWYSFNAVIETKKTHSLLFSSLFGRTLTLKRILIPKLNMDFFMITLHWFFGHYVYAKVKETRKKLKKGTVLNVRYCMCFFTLHKETQGIRH